ncbi:MAG: lysozyme inhibitor LprI family protein [Zoogloeaceae bacterium]|jgi:uncharacterized protein YecT (DUF1311 family)|nr:lysozyme inhibitor LprI family protein [Zoogloeaceae bacterium]
MEKVARKGALVFVFLTNLCFADVDCGNAQTQLEMNECAVKEYEEVDKDLNAIYASFRTSLDSEHKNALKEAQNAWIKFRDLSCALETLGSIGGSIYQMELNICLAEKTRARINEIKKLSGCEEGDISCPSRQ